MKNIMAFGSMDIIAGKLKEITRSQSSNQTIENDDDFKLSFAFQNLEELADNILPKNIDKILVLDLTENNFNGSNDLRFLIGFTSLKTLILDKNNIQSNFIIPCMENLSTLWVNHNNIENLSVFIQNLSTSCPNLTYLSMINNKAAPSYFNGGSLVEYNDYRLFVISKLNKLQMLDHKIITPEERIQSQAVYGTGRLVRYNNQKIGNRHKTKTRNNSISQQQQKQSLSELSKHRLDDKNKKDQINQLDEKNDDDKKELMKHKRKNSKKVENSLSSTENETINKYLELLPELQEDINSNETSKLKSKKSNKKDVVDNINTPTSQLNNEKYSAFESLDILPEVPQKIIDEQSQLDNIEKDNQFILNKLNKFDISDENELAYDQLPEFIPQPSPSFSLLDDIPESLVKQNELKNQNFNSSENINSDSDYIPDELPDLPELPSFN